MDLIKIEKQTGAPRLHRKYLVENIGDFVFEHDHIKEDGHIIFPSSLEDIFKQDVIDYRANQKIELSKILRSENSYSTSENSYKQGTKEWLNKRIGIITASKTPFDISGKKIPTYDAYVNEKVADAFIFNNGGDATEKYTSDAMAIGTELEQYAIERYEEVTGNIVDTRNLIIADSLKIGASPDGVTTIDGKLVNVEVKSVFLKSFLSEIVSGYITKSYKAQLQTQMFILDCDTTHLVIQTQQRSGQALDIIISEVERDEEYVCNMIETIEQYEKDFSDRYSLLDGKIIHEQL